MIIFVYILAVLLLPSRARINGHSLSNLDRILSMGCERGDLSLVQSLAVSELLLNSAHLQKNESSSLTHIISQIEGIKFADFRSATLEHHRARAYDSDVIPPLAQLHLDGNACGGLGDVFYVAAVIVRELRDISMEDPKFQEKIVNGWTTMVTLTSDSGLQWESERHVQNLMDYNGSDYNVLFRAALLTPGVFESQQQLWDTRQRLSSRIDKLISAGADVKLDRLDEFVLSPTFYYIYQGLNDRNLLTRLRTAYKSASPLLSLDGDSEIGERLQKQSYFHQLPSIVCSSNNNESTGTSTDFGSESADVHSSITTTDTVTPQTIICITPSSLSSDPIISRRVSYFNAIKLNESINDIKNEADIGSYPTTCCSKGNMGNMEESNKPQPLDNLPVAQNDPTLSNEVLVQKKKKSKQHRRIRIGFVSAHFRRHSICKLFCGLMVNLNSDMFDVYAFSALQESREDFITRDLRSSLGRKKFINVGKTIVRNRIEVIKRKIDVLVYLDVGMDPTTVVWASARLAPLQLCVWGHPSTTGLSSIDYYISSDLYYHPHHHYHNTLQSSSNITTISPTSSFAAVDAFTEQLVLLDSLGFYFRHPNFTESLPSTTTTTAATIAVATTTTATTTTTEEFKRDIHNHHIEEDYSCSFTHCRWLIDRPAEFYQSLLPLPTPTRTTSNKGTTSLLSVEELKDFILSSSIKENKDKHIHFMSAVGYAALLVPTEGSGGESSSLEDSDLYQERWNTVKYDEDIAFMHDKIRQYYFSIIENTKDNNNFVEADNSHINEKNSLIITAMQALRKEYLTTPKDDSFLFGTEMTLQELISYKLLGKSSVLSGSLDTEEIQIALCPQHLPKFHPSFDRVISGILRRAPHAIVVIIDQNAKKYQWRRTLMRRWQQTFRVDLLQNPSENKASSQRYLYKQWADMLVRVVWTPPLSPAQYQTLLAVGDVMVDPFPFGGGVTTLEALAVCTPVVTVPFNQHQQTNIMDSTKYINTVDGSLYGDKDTKDIADNDASVNVHSVSGAALALRKALNDRGQVGKSDSSNMGSISIEKQQEDMTGSSAVPTLAAGMIRKMSLGSAIEHQLIASNTTQFIDNIVHLLISTNRLKDVSNTSNLHGLRRTLCSDWANHRPKNTPDSSNTLISDKLDTLAKIKPSAMMTLFDESQAVSDWEEFLLNTMSGLMERFPIHTNANS